MTRKVKFATMHNQTNHLPEIGDFGKHLPSKTKTMENLSMEISALGLHVRFSYKGIKHEMLFPSAAVALMTLEPEAEPVAAVASVRRVANA